MKTSSALPLTLKSISSIKLEELSKQRKSFTQQKSEILKAANAVPQHDLRRKVQVLLEGVTRLAGRPRDAFDPSDHYFYSDPNDYSKSDWKVSRDLNIRRFLFQSQYDSSISDDVLRDWIRSLERDIEFQAVRFEHATFYSKMVTEWLSNFKDGDVNNPNASVASDENGDAELGNSAFEEIGRAAMHEQRATWENLVFSPADGDPESVETYLDRLFNKTKLSQEALNNLRKRIKHFGHEMSEFKNCFNTENLKTTSKSLLASDLLSPGKVMILKEFLRNDEVAQEVIDVLNLRFAALNRWSWPEDGVPVEMRRQLNGKYRVFMDEDLIDALLLHHIGLHWSVELRRAFGSFLGSPAWKPNAEPIPKIEYDRRNRFLEKKKDLTYSDKRNEDPTTVNFKRKVMYKDEYFMSQLPTRPEEGQRGYDDDDDSDSDSSDTKRKSPIETKHSLLHLLIAESIIHTRLRGQFTVIRSDFKWFGPSLPHNTLLAVMRFLGVPDNWLRFLKKFLECPLRFSQDGPGGTVRTRTRGVPISHTLSDALGESVLFCMDYAVNQHAGGAFLYRLHDDFWFWGEENTCRKAWRAMADFAAVTGLEFNEEKTGTARLGRRISPQEQKQLQPQSRPKSRPQEQRDDSDDSSNEEMKEDDSESDDNVDEMKDDFDPLPQGDIKWGFLRLDPERGCFLIDQEQIDVHIEELRHQLSACNSIFAWVQAWNSYFSRFFSNNFATPSLGFGREHVEMAINTYSRIERQVLAHTTSTAAGNNGVTDHLRRVIANRFDIHDLPDGFFFFPVESGGLELRNPFISFLAMRENIKKTPQEIIEDVFTKEELNYEAAKKKWQDNESGSYRKWEFGKEESFFPFEEYMSNMESTSNELYHAYRQLLGVPSEAEVPLSADLHSYFKESGKEKTYGLRKKIQKKSQNKGHIVPDWTKMTPYWKWVTEVYHGGMLRKYGDLTAVDRALMPLGVVKVLRQGKVRWQG